MLNIFTMNKSKLLGFRASNDNGKTWFDWYWNLSAKAWMVDEPESKCFTTKEMLANKGSYTKCKPIYV
jgi:hypothetical protein